MLHGPSMASKHVYIILKVSAKEKELEGDNLLISMALREHSLYAGLTHIHSEKALMSFAPDPPFLGTTATKT